MYGKYQFQKLFIGSQRRNWRDSKLDLSMAQLLLSSIGSLFYYGSFDYLQVDSIVWRIFTYVDLDRKEEHSQAPSRMSSLNCSWDYTYRQYANEAT